MLPKGLAHLVARLRRQGPESESPPPPSTDEAAGLRFVPAPSGLLEVRALCLSSPLFCVRGARDGPMLPGPPVRVPLREGQVRAWRQGPVDGPPEGASLVRSSGLEFTVAAGDREWTWRFEVEGAEVSSVARAQTPASLFPETPSVRAMADFLRSLTHDRRTMPRTLQSVARAPLAAATGRVVEHVVSRWPAGGGTSPVVPVLGRMFERLGRRINPDSLEAFCLLVDIERGALTPEGVDRGLQEGGCVPISPEATLAAADFFGLPVDEGTWAEDLGHLGAFRAVRASADDPEVQKVVRHLRSGQRTVLDILEDLARDSGSRRVAEAVRVLRPLVPSGQIRVNDEQQALLPLLEASGRRVHPQTLIALCLFVDLEVGNLDDPAALAERADRLDTSMYAMIAGAGAFGLDLTAWSLDGSPREDPVPVLTELAGRAEGGLLACFRKPGEPGRWWEWVRASLEVAPRLPWGLEFTGIVLARLAEEAGPVLLTPSARLRPLGPAQLHGAGEDLSREVLALRKLHGAVRRVGPRPAERLSLRRHSQHLEEALEWLGSGKASALDGAVHPETRRLLVAEARRDIGRDFMVLRQAAEASPETLALHLVLALCRSSEVELPGTFKQFDEKRLRAMLSDHLAGMLEGEDPPTRARGAVLLATSDHVPDRATRMLAEYHLSTARQDPDPSVGEAALDGTVRLALMEVQPLPAVVEIAATSPDALEARESDARLQHAALEAALREMRDWLARVAEADPLRPMSLPVTDSQGALDPSRARPVAEILAAVQQASKGELGTLRLFALASVDELSAMARALLDSFRLLARSTGCRLQDLAPSELDHRLLVEEQSARLLHHWGALPHLGGRGRGFAVYRVPPGRTCAVWAMRERLPGQFVQEESPFFKDLLELSRRVDPGRLRVLRLRPRPPLSEESSAVTETRVELRDVEILDPVSVSFVPFVRMLALQRALLGLEQEPWEDVRAAASLAEGRRPEVAAGGAPVEVERPAAVSLEGVAGTLGRLLELDPSREQEVLDLLEDAMATGP